MPKEKRVYYIIPKRVLEGMNPGALLDMLRYDYCRVESNAPSGWYLLSNENGPCVARWTSFSIPPTAIRGPFKDAYEACEHARGVHLSG